jgi:hypothetical protein
MAEPENPGLASGRRCIAALQALLGSAADAGGAADTPSSGYSLDVATFVAEADPLAVYQLLAISAALVRFGSAASGRGEDEIVEEIGRSFEG